MSLEANGGVGDVILARDEQLNRFVALKEIPARIADDRNSQDRFLQEAELTARLEHPGIVPVYGLGRHPDGRPFYAMRMIRGVRLRVAIDDLHRKRSSHDRRYELEMRRLLSRFVAVCNTIAYAHSQGILHRDIKPDNIVLGPYGETLVVDWGFGESIGSRNDESAPVPDDDIQPPARHDATQAGMPVGTPAYASPEQALGWHNRLTPASDVYSLGATLYTILTGVDPIANRDGASYRIQLQTRVDPRPRELNPRLPKSLEAVCLKAMAGSVTDRYQTAPGLAADIEAALAGEPVTAWREPIQARAARWIRRHRTWVATGAASFAVLFVACLVIVALQKAANAKLATANVRISAASDDTAIERDNADRNFQMAKDAVDRYFTQVSEDRRLATQGMEPLRRDLLKSAGQFYERFANRQSENPVVQFDRAWAEFRLASIVEETGSTADAVSQYETAAQSFRGVIKAATGPVLRSRDGLLMCQINLSVLFDRLGRPDKGEASLAEALSLAHSLIAESPQALLFRHHLARCLGIQGRRAIEQGQIETARKAYRDEIRVREQLVQFQPDERTFQVELAEADRNLAAVERRYERYNEAREFIDKSLVIDRRLARKSPDDGFLTHVLARTSTFSADLLAVAGRVDDSRNAYWEAVKLQTALVRKHPDVLEYRAELAATADNFGVFCFDRGEFGTAEKVFGLALGHAERLATDYPARPDYQMTFATSLVNAAQVYIATERLAAAEQWLSHARDIRDQLRRDFPNQPEREEELGSVCLALAVVETSTKHPEPAQRHLQMAVEVFRRLMPAHPDVPLYAERLGACFKQQGDLLKSLNRFDEADAAYGNALPIERQLVAAHPSVLRHRQDLARVCVNLGNLRLQRSRAADAIAAFDEGVQSLPQTMPSTLDNEAKSLLYKSFGGRALAREIQGDLPRTIADLEKAIEFALPDHSNVLRLKLAKTLSVTGQSDRAVDVADTIDTEAASRGASAFDLAVVYFRAAAANAGKSVSDKERIAVRGRRIEQGLKLLQRAFDAGYFSKASTREQLKNSPFQPLLQSNQTFKRLVSAIEKKAKGAAK